MPSYPPTEVNCTPLSPTSLSLFWTPPPPRALQGASQGSAVYWRPLLLWRPGETQQQSVAGERTRITGLLPYHNYSIQVAARTRAGEGPRSPPCLCSTLEAVPVPPAGVTAVPVSNTAILLAWLPPDPASGAVVKYSIHITTMTAGRPHTKVLEAGAGTRSQQVGGLVPGQPYSVCVAASTVAGAGPCSQVVVETPRTPGPPLMSSLPTKLDALFGSSVRLPCLAVGSPEPTTVWQHNGTAVEDSDVGRPDLVLQDLQPDQAGNWTCVASSAAGQSKVTHQLAVHAAQYNGVPPAPPVLALAAARPTELSLSWPAHPDGGSPVTSYRLHYRDRWAGWRLLRLPPRPRTATLTGLKALPLVTIDVDSFEMQAILQCELCGSV